MKSLHKVLDIIEAMAKSGSIGIRELSVQTGYPPPTVHRITSTLILRNYIKQDPETKKLSLSVQFLGLGTQVQQQFNLTGIARPHLESLMAESKESVNLAVQDGDYVAYLDHVRSNYSMLQLFTRPGARVPLYCTGVGKMFLSQWPREEVEVYLDRVLLIPHTSETIIDRRKLMDELVQIRAAGYSVDNEEMERGVRCVAALVWDHRGRPAGAVSITGAAMRITPTRIRSFARSVQSCANAISRELGYAGGV
ncbi:MAG: IclR family transcriptional regulator [Desulfobacteraceae bacterium]|nr:MAG: IclR family transcriptional regulator [Desulfobacteraceae bacterium]